VRDPLPHRASLLVPRLWRALCLALALVIVFNLFFLAAKPFAAGLFPAPWDKVAYLTVYGGLTVLLWLGTGGRMTFTVIAAVVAIGGLDELHQAAIPGRVADVADFAVDVVAGLAAGTLMLLLARRKWKTEPVCAE
jgi:VanZ family protein